MVSGHIKVVMDDVSEEEFGPGDTAIVPPGHYAWVVGNEPVVATSRRDPWSSPDSDIDLGTYEKEYPKSLFNKA